jgi:aspartyl-tRNA(Asn)/glutamyl-tRNA(Gln) amidotransferase subunit C
MSLSQDQIARIARLARIALEAEESGPVLERLNRVLGLIDQLQAVDTSAIAPMSYPLDAAMTAVQRLRSDAVTEADLHAEFQRVAPAVEDGLYLVPKVIE